MRSEIRSRDGDEGTIVYSARFDSSREAFHGTVPVLEMLTGRVLHVVTLIRIETCSAWTTEDAAVRQAVTVDGILAE